MQLTLVNLEKQIGKPLVKETTASMYYWGTVYIWSPVFEKWVETNDRTSFKPGDEIPQRGRRLVAIIDE